MNPGTAFFSNSTRSCAASPPHTADGRCRVRAAVPALAYIAGALAHKSQKIQFEVGAVLGSSPYAHEDFRIAGVLPAVIDLPDFGGSLRGSPPPAKKIAGIEPDDAVHGQGGSSVPF